MVSLCYRVSGLLSRGSMSSSAPGVSLLVAGGIYSGVERARTTLYEWIQTKRHLQGNKPTIMAISERTSTPIACIPYVHKTEVYKTVPATKVRRGIT